MKEINKILVITLSNIGDVILTTPVIKLLKERFPESSLSVMCSNRVAELFHPDPLVENVIVYNKHIPLSKKIELTFRLRKMNYDIVVDLRHTLFPLFLGAKYSNAVFKLRKNMNIHKRDFHLKDLLELNLNLEIEKKLPYIHISEETRKEVEGMLEKKMGEKKKYIVVSPGGGSNAKLWPKEKFLELCKLIESNFNYKFFLVGDKKDRKITEWICNSINSKNQLIDIAGETSLLELGEVIKRANLLITNDSGILHIGSAVKTPVVALFGPTNEINYGPLGEKTKVIKKEMDCRPCVYAQCKSSQPCLDKIRVSEVYEAVKNFLN